DPSLNTAVVTAGGSGNITTSGGSIAGLSVALSSTTGNIGASGVPVRVNTSFVTGNTGGTGTVILSDSNTFASILGASQSGGAFSLTTAGPLSVTGNVTTNAATTSTLGNLSLIMTAGATLNIAKSLTANGGSIVIQNQNASGSITFTDTPTI